MSKGKITQIPSYSKLQNICGKEESTVQRDQIPETFDSLLTHDNNQQQQVQHQQYIDQNELQKKESSSLSDGTVSHPSVSSTGRMDSDMEDDRLKPKIHSFHHKKKDDRAVTLIRPSGPAYRRRQKCMTAAKDIFSNLNKAFDLSTFPIRKIAFILGSSLVTPKETFVLTFPDNHLEGKNIPLDTVKKSFFRKLVLSDFIESFGEPGSSYSLQKLFVLILTNRDSDIQWFTPAPRFSLPHRGKLYNVSLTNQPIQDTSLYVSGSDESILEVSGINPMELTMDLQSPATSRTQSNMELSSPMSLAFNSELSSPACTEPGAKRQRLMMTTSFEEVCDIEDVIWYQAPITFQGFK